MFENRGVDDLPLMPLPTPGASHTAAGILHADLDSFYASVAQRDDPSLKGRPVLIGGGPNGGVVLAASYEAKAYGVRGGMGGREAYRRCPQAVTVRTDFTAYVEASKRVFEIFRDTTPLVEGISIDEAFLDVRGLRRLVGSPESIARGLRARVAAEVGLPISVGVARTKYLAKVASQVSKPDGLLVVEPAEELEFLHPLPVELLWGVGPVTSRALRSRGITTVGELAAADRDRLADLVGRAAGHHLWALANLFDPRPVRTGRRRGSVGSQSALGSARRPHSPEELDAVLLGLLDRVTRRLRAGERIGRTITLRLRFDDFTRATRSTTLRNPTGTTAIWLEVARGLLVQAHPLIAARGCTLLGISISGLADARTEQPELPLFGPDTAPVDRAVDAVRRRFGNEALSRGALVGRRIGFEAPLLPDRASGTGPDD